MQDRPAIPLLILQPGENGLDLDALFAMARAYSQAGLLISDYGHHRDEPVFAFPAVVCAGFAIELYLKFFWMLGHVESGAEGNIKTIGHKLPELWGRLQEKYHVIIAGMHRNKSGKPLDDAIEMRVSLFLKTLNEIGDSPFVKWRYAHELTGIGHMSHAVIQEILNALEQAAIYVMRDRQSDDVMGDGQKSIMDGLAGVPASHDWRADPLGSAAKWLQRGKPLLLGRDSPLRRIPVNIAPSTAFHLDEIRQAIESIDVAYMRLHQELTSLALQTPAPEEICVISATVFFDAWGIIWAVNKFYQAYTGFPGIVFDKPRAGYETLESVTQSARLLYEISSDLQSRESIILPNKLPTLGEITWMTGVQDGAQKVAWHCTLRPGWLTAIPNEENGPLLSTLHFPSDSITLALAGNKADLSVVRLHIAARLLHLEAQLLKIFDSPSQKDIPVFSDFFSRRPVSPI